MNDNQFTIAGNMVKDPVIAITTNGKSVVNFRLASTPRRFDASLREWVNGESVYLTVNCWHRLAERVHESLHAGDPVIVSGRLRQRSYEVNGERRTVFEVEAAHVGPDLNRVSVQLVKARRDLVAAPAADVAGEASLSSGPLVPIGSEVAA